MNKNNMGKKQFEQHLVLIIFKPSIKSNFFKPLNFQMGALWCRILTVCVWGHNKSNSSNVKRKGKVHDHNIYTCREFNQTKAATKCMDHVK